MKNKSSLCQTVQQQILENSDNYDQDHLEYCTQCRNFLNHHNLIRSNISDNENDLMPRPDIIYTMQNQLQSEAGNFLAGIKAFLFYPVPAYQIVGGLILLLCLTFGSRFLTNSGDAAGEEGSFYLADTTTERTNHAGISVFEDTIWVKHMETF